MLYYRLSLLCITDVVSDLALCVVVVVTVVVLLQKLGPANTLHFVVRDVKKVSPGQW